MAKPYAAAQCAAEVRRIHLHRGNAAPTVEMITAAYNAYVHTPRERDWSAVEIRQATAFLREIGFHPADPIELGALLPPDARMANGDPVEEANVLLWPSCAQELCVAPNRMLATLEGLEMDTVKWSRRAPKTNGLQNKVARHNCCFTDLREEVRDPDPDDVTEIRARHKHPKNPAIKFTNYSFRAVPTLAAFRRRLALVLGPFGYKVRGMFCELNKYWDASPETLPMAKASGIGRHGDTERGHGRGPGSVNCLKLGAHIPLLYAWYKKSMPAGVASGVDPATIEDPTQPRVALVAHKDVAVASAVVSIGHGGFYLMSRKAIGFDWKKRDWALRHCAGGRKYTGLPKAYYERLVASGVEAGRPQFGVAYSLTFSDCVENDSETPELQFRTPHIG